VFPRFEGRERKRVEMRFAHMKRILRLDRLPARFIGNVPLPRQNCGNMARPRSAREPIGMTDNGERRCPSQL
jgi:hypothetical protein